MMWEQCMFESQIFGCGNVYHSNFIININFISTLILSC
jgi:hypothetical protein